MTVVLTGGGTGGHIYPALAIGEALARRGAAVRYIGSRTGPEAHIVPRAGVAFAGVTVGNLSRSRPASVAAAVLKGAREAWSELGACDARAIVSSGGYVSAPVALAGWARRIPILLHEPNATAGKANRWQGRFAARVALGFASAEKDFPPGRCVVTGVSVRTPGPSVPRAEARRRFGLDESAPVLLVVGGSQGSVALNEAVLGALDGIDALGFQVLHQTGPRNFEGRAREESDRRAGYRAVPYIDDMPAAYGAADVILCRAGASTLAECALYGVPPVFVPLALAGGHQRHNAGMFAAEGAARVLEQERLSPDSLVEVLREMADGPAREAMREALRTFARPDAADDIAGIAMELAGGRRYGET